MAKSVVSIVKGTDPDQMVEEALALIGGVEAFVKPGATVVVKPNAGHEYGPESGVCTSPAVTAAVVKALRKGKPKEIILAESAATGCDTLRCFEISGIQAACEAAGIDRVIDIKRERDLITVPIPNARSEIKEFKLPRFLLEADLVVNVPIFKSHVSVVFTCALKNIKGVVQDKVHYEMHQTDLAAAMVDIWSVLKNVNLTIADMVRPQEGFGPHCGMATDFGCVVASADPVAVDATACRMVGLDINKSDYFRASLDQGLGNFRESDIEIRGNSIAEVYKPLWLPHTEGFGRWPDYAIYDTGCSSCQSLLVFTLARLQALEQYEQNAGLSVLSGRYKELPEGVKPGDPILLFGNCTRPLRNKLEKMGIPYVYVDGCPPGEPMPYYAVVTRKNQPDPEMMDDPEKRLAFRENMEKENAKVIAWIAEQAEKLRKKP